MQSTHIHRANQAPTHRRRPRTALPLHTEKDYRNLLKFQIQEMSRANFFFQLDTISIANNEADRITIVLVFK